MKKTPLELFEEITSDLPTNGQQQITASVLRTILQDIVDSALQKNVTIVTTTPYTYLDNSRGNLIVVNNAGATAISIAQPGAGNLFVAGWSSQIRNQGAGNVTITPAASTINGAATLVLTTGQGAELVSDGTNYWAILN